MAAFARRPDGTTARLSDVIEYLHGDALEGQSELQATLLLRELNRLLAAE